MKVKLFSLAVTLFASLTMNGAESKKVSISQEVLKDKIAGGWAGKMIGVTYGAPTEFKALGKTFEDPITWKPSDVKGSIWQDDIYVQLTFMETMDQFGMNAPTKKFQELFAKSGYMLWHANVQARKNYFDNIFPPLSGNPKYNLHADDIDFQIEADYIGFMCPAMPAQASAMANRIGHIMNYGDGVYGGVFVAALYSEAFVNSNIDQIVEKALKSIPAGSDYAKIVNDVILLHQHYPSDWRKAWQELENKWGKDHICEAGAAFNIDAKLNGAFIVMGLLYGEGDIRKTMEVSTRCGQDSDCNPSNAAAVLGVIKGLKGMPQDYQDAVKAMGDSLFINTNYSFNKAVKRTLDYAKKIVVNNGGTVSDKEITLIPQAPKSLPLEVAFPKTVFKQRDDVFSSSFRTKGNWTEKDKKVKYCGKAGSEISYTFEGTGVSIMGNWVKDGGMADVFVDGQFKRTIDNYFFYAKQEHGGINIFHILNLAKGKHTVRLVVKNRKNPRSEGTNIYVSGAIVYDTAPKASENHKFSFQ